MHDCFSFDECMFFWCTPTLFEEFECEFESENNKEEGVGVRSLARNISSAEGCARAPGWGLRWVTSESIIHTNMHKPNNNLVNA